MSRVIAFLIIIIPGIMATMGVKVMRDTLFQEQYMPFGLWFQFLVGFLMFVIGLSFIGGFIHFRDNKRKKVTTRRFNR